MHWSVGRHIQEYYPTCKEAIGKSGARDSSIIEEERRESGHGGPSGYDGHDGYGGHGGHNGC